MFFKGRGITFIVWDEDVTSNDKVGEGVISVDALPNGEWEGEVPI